MKYAFTYCMCPLKFHLCLEGNQGQNHVGAHLNLHPCHMILILHLWKQHLEIVLHFVIFTFEYFSPKVGELRLKTFSLFGYLIPPIHRLICFIINIKFFRSLMNSWHLGIEIVPYHVFYMGLRKVLTGSAMHSFHLDCKYCACTFVILMSVRISLTYYMYRNTEEVGKSCRKYLSGY